ncbi:Predicted transcriptional regulator [Arthrobacter sp. 9AX]|uniref:helix-turn-helix transcriptional regulator n=1 Tax=Arthrobacter sp. 9AX TaxID=2653131 RepID=UPI0012F11EC3|nr:helix-turn-helix domain-containing protein [Arthrobacter sp. 9AX]VXC38731.1 Predicted transcriptional regulator [Arthrobacter sp. 9AX]
METKLLTPAELGRMLDKTPASLAQWRYQGIGPRFVKVGRGVRYRQTDVDGWLDANTVQRTGEEPALSA